MKFFAIILGTVAFFRTSYMEESDNHQSDILLKYRQGVEDLKVRQRIGREAVSKEIYASANTHGINLPPGYNRFQLPKPADSPMPIFVFLNISNILDWDEMNEVIAASSKCVIRAYIYFWTSAIRNVVQIQLVKLNMRLKVMWTDFRILEFNNNTNTYQGNGKPLIEYLSLDEIERMRKTNNDPEMLSSIWKPNLFIDRLLSVDQPVLMTKPLTVRYIPELGWFEYITRIQIKIDCPMDFRYYPADTQTCDLPIRSYSYTKSNMNLSWHKMGVYLTNLEVSSFRVRIDDVRRYNLAKSDDPHEVHDVLGFKLFARRGLSYHLIQTYLASSFYIIITTLCFLLPPTMIEARIGMSMTTLLTLTAMFASVRESTPIVSYTKAIDIWMVGCIFFVFLTLFQFTFSTWLKHVNKAKIEAQMKHIDKAKGAQNEGFESDLKFRYSESTNDAVGTVFSTETLEKYGKLSMFFEAYNFPLFLGIFAVYTLIYWTWLLTASKYYNWTVDSTWNRIG